MQFLLYVLFFVVCIAKVDGQNLNGWPVCANATFTKHGVVDAEKMLYECSENIPSSLLIPSYFSIDEAHPYSPISVMIQVVVNNLISVDDITSEMTMDLYLRLTWTDSRWNMPYLFPNVNPECTLDGVDVTQYVRNSNNALNVWLPDVVFTDETNFILISELVKIKPNGVFYWSRHIALTFAEPQMYFGSFPLDSQNFSLRMQSYSYDSKFVQLTFANPPVTFNNNTQQNTTNVQMNALWVYDNYSAYITDEPMPNTVNPNRHFFCGNVNLKFTRQSLGIVYRLALPVTIFSVIVGLSFWADIDKRIEVTLQMLLVVAALYLIIGESIPFVGYLTTMDTFVTLTFGLLSVATGIHFLTLLFERKKEKYPLNELFADCLVHFFRIMWIPCAFLILITFFHIDIPVLVACLVIAATAGVVNGWMKRAFVIDSFNSSIVNLRVKAAKIDKQKAERAEENARRVAQGMKPLTAEDDAGKERLQDLNALERLALHYTEHMVFEDALKRDKKKKKHSGGDAEEGIELSEVYNAVRDSLIQILPSLTPRHRPAQPPSSYPIGYPPSPYADEEEGHEMGMTANPMAKVAEMYQHQALRHSYSPNAAAVVMTTADGNGAAAGGAGGAGGEGRRTGSLPIPPPIVTVSQTARTSPEASEGRNSGSSGTDEAAAHV